MGDSRLEFHSGFVALVGRPNAGKSTLLNALLGEKIAITSNTPQTTRHRLSGIVNRPSAQIVLVDTPGLHKPHDALGEEVNRSARHAISDVDVVAFLIDSSKPVGKGDAWIASLIARADAGTKKLLVFTKLDLIDEAALDAQAARAKALGTFDATLALSACTGAGLEAFTQTLIDLLPDGPQWFPPDMTTDQSLEVMIAEFIREKVLLGTRDEVPHAVGVAIDEITQEFTADTVDARDIADTAGDADGEGDTPTMTHIYATIYVERESQKGIIVGKGGAMIKQIGTAARADLETLLATKVYLDLTVKVKKDWRRSATQIRRFGYGEGG
ncbi:MAG: GTPase Era [Coriobacteriia bacterium]|nr:GTPase Era [Coriobacteriia bacterium]